MSLLIYSHLKDLPAVLLLLGGAGYSISRKKLTPLAALTGLFCGAVLYIRVGYTGLFLLTAFFSLGTVATSWGKKLKQQLKPAGDELLRKPGQVLANAGSAALFALLMPVFPLHTIALQLMLTASMASATADTLASELGMLYGKNFYNCLTWKKDQRGLDGVVSLEGTLIGIVGAAIIAFIYAIGVNPDYRLVILIVIAGASGNFIDSVFGASLERRKLLNNDGVNFISTLFAAGVALLLYNLDK